MNFYHRASALAKNILFPIFCLGCEQEGIWVCNNCASMVETAGVFCCPVCHKETERGEACGACRLNSYLSSHAAVTVYREDALIGRMIRTYKYLYAEGIVPVLQMYIVSFFSLHPPLFSSLDAIVPVPLHPKRRAERGFNQSEYLAEAVGICIGTPVRSLLCRKRYTSSQALLSKAARRENVHDAFTCKGESVLDGARILLVDDVFTTGATMQECARALLKAGASEVQGMSVARG
ncbi:MAG: ComF family protein [Patescibacteria group bacterium]